MLHRLAEALVAFGPLGVVLIATLDSAGVPLPAGVDALLITTAALSPPKAYFAAMLATIGSIAGNWFLFSIARKGGEAYLASHTESAQARKFREWFQHYGLITVFIPTFVPIVPLPLKVFVLSAGALGVRTRSFLLTILAGRIPRFLAMAYLGSQLGTHSMPWLREHALYLSIIAAALFVVLFAAVKYIDYKKRNQATVNA